MDYPEIRDVGLNDKFSSITIPPGLRVWAYEHGSFSGNVRDYRYTIDFTHDFNDIISSFSVYRYQVCFYEHYWYEGKVFCSGLGRVSYHEINGEGLNDRFSGVTVPPGLKAIAYEHAGCGGGSRTYTDNSNAFYDFNDIISSFVVELNI